MKHPVPKNKWRITEENYEHYEQKFRNYVNQIAINPYECEVLMDKKYEYGQNSYKIWDYEIHYNDGFVLQIDIAMGGEGLGCFELNFYKTDVGYNDVNKIDNAYLDTIYNLCKYCLYNFPLNSESIKSAINKKSEYDGYIYYYSNEWQNDDFFPSYILIYSREVQNSPNLYNIQIHAQGYMTDENVWP